MSEHDLTRRVRRLLAGLRASRKPVWYVKIHGGGSFQRKALPDTLVMISGTAIALETKTPESARPLPRDSQRAELRIMSHAGWQTHISNSYNFIEGLVHDTLNGENRFQAGILYINGEEAPWSEWLAAKNTIRSDSTS